MSALVNPFVTMPPIWSSYSSSATFSPNLAAATAAAIPPGVAPTTTTSALSSAPLDEAQRIERQTAQRIAFFGNEREFIRGTGVDEEPYLIRFLASGRALHELFGEIPYGT